MNTNEKIKETLIEQLDVLAKTSERTSDAAEICSLSHAIIGTVKFIREHGI